MFTPGRARTVCWYRSIGARFAAGARSARDSLEAVRLSYSRAAVQPQRAVGLLDHPGVFDRHEPGRGVGALDHVDVDTQDRAVDRQIVFAPGIDESPGHGRSVRDDLVQ